MSTGCVDCACVDCAFLDLARRMMQALLPSLSSHSSSEIVRALTVGGCMVWEAMQASHPRMLILEGHHQEVVRFFFMCGHVLLGVTTSGNRTNIIHIVYHVRRSPSKSQPEGHAHPYWFSAPPPSGSRLDH